MTHLGRLTFVVDGEPIAKGRARSTRSGHHYTPKKTQEAEAHVRYIAQSTIGLSGYVVEKDVPLAMSCCFMLTKPKSGPNSKRADGEGCTKKPDLDNLVKLVKDALNGVAYDDDSAIVKLTAEKQWSSHPCTIVNVWRLT